MLSSAESASGLGVLSSGRNGGESAMGASQLWSWVLLLSTFFFWRAGLSQLPGVQRGRCLPENTGSAVSTTLPDSPPGLPRQTMSARRYTALR